jgi:hypothetical protein
MLIYRIFSSQFFKIHLFSHFNNYERLHTILQQDNYLLTELIDLY